jgi:hypothetical protein
MIDFAEFSNGAINSTSPNNPVWEGTGVFDNIMEAINGNTKVQHDSGRITAAVYTTKYNQ